MSSLIVEDKVRKLQRILRKNQEEMSSTDFDPVPYLELRDRAETDDLRPPPFQGTLVSDTIYLGGVSEAMYPSALMDRGIVGIINMAGRQCKDFQRMEKAMASDSDRVVSQWERVEFSREWYGRVTGVGDEFHYCVIDAEDHPRYRMRDHFDECCDFIELMKGKPVLVHCVQGLNRSAAVVVAYLLRSTRRGLEFIINDISKKRMKILSNRSFLKELVLYEMELMGEIAEVEKPVQRETRMVKIGNVVERI